MCQSGGNLVPQTHSETFDKFLSSSFNKNGTKNQFKQTLLLIENSN